MPTYQELEVKVAGLENQIFWMNNALVWMMTTLKQTTQSPIVGAEPKTKTFLQIYQEAVAMKVQELQTKEKQSEESVTSYVNDSTDGLPSNGTGPEGS